MKKWILIFVSLLILGVVGGIMGYKFIYNKPHRDFEKAKPDYSLSSEVLFSAFSNSRAEAEKTYNGKVLEIQGTISEIESFDSLTIIVFSLREGMFGDEGIRCTMLPAHNKNAESLAVGTKVTVKGYCTGFNDTDVILEKCTIQ